MNEWIEYRMCICDLKMGRLTEQVLSDSHRFFDGTQEWIASDCLFSWCEIDSILISRPDKTKFFCYVSKSCWLFWKFLFERYGDFVTRLSCLVRPKVIPTPSYQGIDPLCDVMTSPSRMRDSRGWISFMSVSQSNQKPTLVFTMNH